MSSDSEKATMLNNRGNEFLRAGKFGKAERLLSKALKRSSADKVTASILTNLAIVFVNTGRTAEALDCCAQALRLVPDHANAWFTNGLAYQISDQNEDAVVSFGTFLQHSQGANPRQIADAKSRVAHLRKS